MNRYTAGDVDESLSIMQEAAQWLIDTGRPMWHLKDLTREAIANPAEDFIVLWDGEQGVSTLTLSFADPYFWPDIPSGTSGFIHKLSVRRAYAGSGVAESIVKIAAEICKSKGIYELRLDCDPHRSGLCAFYEHIGFNRVQEKTIQTVRFGTIDLAYYLMNISR